MASTHIDYRKIDYDQLIDKPITRVASGVNPNTLTTAGVYDRGDGNRFIVTVDGQNVVQTIELKDGYQERTSTNGGSNWTEWKDISFANPGEEVMPTPSAEEEGKIIQYVGETDANFTHGYFYECVGDGQTPETYSWINVQVQDNPGQAETMPTPSAENVGTIIQYTGDTNQYYTHAHFYEVIEDPENPGQYIYKEVDTQSVSADSVSYDNTDSGLTATNIQEAIDEIAPETIVVDDYSAVQGPCEDGFHIPSAREFDDLMSIMTTLNLTAFEDYSTKLHIPLAGYRTAIYYNPASIQHQGGVGSYWTYSPTYDIGHTVGENDAIEFRIFDDNQIDIWDDVRSAGSSIRAFKNGYEEPTASWTVVDGSLGSAGIFYNATLGLISLTNGNDKNITIQDKNVGATVVYNYGDTLTQDNMGNHFQRGNNYGFPSTGTISNTSGTQVDTSSYGPNTYSSDVFIIEPDSAHIDQDWSNPHNDNLWGGVTGVQHITIKGYDSQNIVYDNSTSIFNSTNVQDVIDEISDKIENLDESKIFFIPNGQSWGYIGQEMAEWFTGNEWFDWTNDRIKCPIYILGGNGLTFYTLYGIDNNITNGTFDLKIGWVGQQSYNRSSYTDTGLGLIKYCFLYSNGTYTYDKVETNRWIQTAYRYLRTDVNYSVPYMPTYDGSPATKKYVDEKTQAQTLSKNYTLSSSDGADLKITLPSKNAMYTLTINTDSPTEYNCIVSTTNYSSMGEVGIEIEGLSNSSVRAYYTISSSGNVLYLTNLYASSFDSMSGTISLISNSVTQTEFENIEIAMFDESDLPSGAIEIDLNSSEGGDNHEVVTQAQYDALTPEQKAAKVYMIKGNGVAPTPGGGSAEDTSYDNTSSGLQADNLQDAIDELYNYIRKIDLVEENQNELLFTKSIATPFEIKDNAAGTPFTPEETYLVYYTYKTPMSAGNQDTVGYFGFEEYVAGGWKFIESQAGYPASYGSAHQRRNKIFLKAGHVYRTNNYSPYSAGHGQFVSINVLVIDDGGQKPEAKEIILKISPTEGYIQTPRFGTAVYAYSENDDKQYFFDNGSINIASEAESDIIHIKPFVNNIGRAKNFKYDGSSLAPSLIELIQDTTYDGYNTTDSLTTIGTGYRSNQFKGCTNLTRVEEDNDITGVTSIGDNFKYGQFSGCTKLTTTIEENIPDTVTTIGNGFMHSQYSGCTALTTATEVEIPDSVTTIGNDYMRSMFEGCTALTNIPFGESELPDSVTSVGNNYMYSMFKGCTALTTVGNTKLGDGVISVGDYFKAYQFQNCTALTTVGSIKLGDSVVSVGNYFKAYQFQGCTSLLSFQNEDMPYSLQTIGTYYMTQQYSGCSAMTTAGDEVITNSLVSIGENGRYRQYYQCTSLLASANEVTKSGGTASELLTIGNAYKKNQYEGCTSITQTGTESMPNVPIAIGNEYKRTQFSGCTALSTLSDEVISNSVVSIGTYYRAEQYPTGANISTTAKEVATGTNSQSGTTIGDYYKYRQYHDNAHIITTGEEALPGNTVSIGDNYRREMYTSCDNLTDAADEFMPNSVTSIGNYFRYQQFSDCGSITSNAKEALPHSVTTIGNGFRNYQYNYCISLTTVKEEALSSGITTIGSSFRSYQFRGCTAITSITGWKDSAVGGSSYRDSQFYNCNTNKTVRVLTDVGYNSSTSALYNTYVTEVQVPTEYLDNFINTNNYPRRSIDDSKFVGY